MFQSLSLFKSIQCPFYKYDLCFRPYCQFSHIIKELTTDHKRSSNENIEGINQQKKIKKNKKKSENCSLLISEKNNLEENEQNKQTNHSEQIEIRKRKESSIETLLETKNKTFSESLRPNLLFPIFVVNSKVHYEIRKKALEKIHQKLKSERSDGNSIEKAQQNELDIYKKASSNTYNLLITKFLMDISNKQEPKERRTKSVYARFLNYILRKSELIGNEYVTYEALEENKRKIDDHLCCFIDSEANRQVVRTCKRCKTQFSYNNSNSPILRCSFVQLSDTNKKSERFYLCCNGDSNTNGCQTINTHVWENKQIDYCHTFPTIPRPNKPIGIFICYEEIVMSLEETGKVFAVDCEMCYTRVGNELTRVTVINEYEEVILDKFVKPLNDIIDYNTEFSGIVEKDLENVTDTLQDIQTQLLELFDSDTILIGHSLNSDLHALKIVHERVIDTSVLYPHPSGLPLKSSLKFLAETILKKKIQQVGRSGHDSFEDALTSFQLVMKHLTNELIEEKKQNIS